MKSKISQRYTETYAPVVLNSVDYKVIDDSYPFSLNHISSIRISLSILIHIMCYYTLW